MDPVLETIWGLLFGLVNQGMKTRTPKVVPLKVPVHVLLIWFGLFVPAV